MIVPGGGKKAKASDVSKEDYADEYKSVYAEAKGLGEKLMLGQA